MAHTIIHFEIPADDVEKLAAFYRDLFGWKIEKPPGPMDYWLIETAPAGQGVGGGMMQRVVPQQRPTNYISVESVEEYSKKVVDLGGRIIVPRQAVPQVGYFAMAIDPQGNDFSIFEDDPSAQ